MKLVIDIGNSRIKWALIKNKEFSFQGALSHQAKDSTVLLNKIWSSLPPVKKIIVANVGGEKWAKTIKAYVNRRCGKTVKFVKPQLKFGSIKNAYATPLLLGSDRWAQVIAASQFYPKAFCVLGCGTSITIDIVDKNGYLIGGCIAPGLNLMCESLVNRAAKLNRLKKDFFQPQKKYSIFLEAKTTRSNLIQGALMMSASFLKSSINLLQSKEGPAMHFLITGGDAEFLLPHLPACVEHHPHLSLQGINTLSR